MMSMYQCSHSKVQGEKATERRRELLSDSSHTATVSCLYSEPWGGTQCDTKHCTVGAASGANPHSLNLQ